MKHIKPFNESSQDEDLYKEVEYNEYKYFRRSHIPEKITKREINILVQPSNDGFEIQSQCDHSLVCVDNTHEYFIYKFEDDWWTIDSLDVSQDWPEQRQVCYICDGIDGLIKALKL